MAKSNGATAVVESQDNVQAIIKIERIDVERLLVPVVGTSPLIVHRFSEKAKRQMLENMQGKKAVKVPKDPHAEYLACFYRYEAGNDVPFRSGVPAAAFQQATIGGARFYRGVTMTSLRQGIFMRGERGVDGVGLFEIIGTPEMREDVVTVGRGTDLRYRPVFNEWSAILSVRFVASLIDRDSVLSLINAGGMGVGVGEWRPEKSGEFGCYEIDQDREVITVSN